MADIELVIKIPKETYKRIQGLVSVDYFEHDMCGFSMKRIAEGIPLPKCRGDLIDKKEAISLIMEGKNDKAYFGTVDKDWEVIDFLKTISPTVEADKEK